MATNFVSQAKHKPIFTPYESVLAVDDRSEICFQYLSVSTNDRQIVMDARVRDIARPRSRPLSIHILRGYLCSRHINKTELN